LLRQVWVNGLRCHKKYIVFHHSLPRSFPQHQPCCIAIGTSTWSYIHFCVPWKYTAIFCLDHNNDVDERLALI
jgi:hypothetical protein